jgi:hypothetical protein
MQQKQSALAPNRQMNRNAGFSLLEVLAALVVTMLLIVALTPLVSQMLATWNHGSEVADTVEFRVRGLGVLRGDLRHAIVWTGFGRTDNMLVFRGNETSMTFPAVSGLGEGREGLEMISIEVASSANGRALIRRRAPVIGTTYTAFAYPVVLFSGPYKYLLKYYSREGEEKPVWVDPLSFPARVVLNIFDGRGRLSSVPIEIPILATISPACLVSASLPGCPAFPKREEDDELQKTFGNQISQ